ncbi:hypothetical protein G7Y89_g10359 [Cudoniella acicularis]|uniref:Phytochrome chromophore attachment site domain-containing protein n=1 Tax=Cudoniella acicularis TaxID=354080 RepID=A0A8H4W1Q2_9HELO|nr:hypothetical protein G7Y89_g10359 [Cudoniella acicularis]
MRGTHNLIRNGRADESDRLENSQHKYGKQPAWMFYDTIIDGRKGPARFWEKWEGTIDSTKYDAFILSCIQTFFEEHDDGHYIFILDSGPLLGARYNPSSISFAQLRVIIIEAWNAVPEDYIVTLYDSWWNRCQAVIDAHGGPTKVFTGGIADKERPPRRRCEDEPIHIPGTIQSFDSLLGLKYNDRGDLQVRIASENTHKILGYGPETRLDIFQMTLTFPFEPEIRLWCAIHLAPSPENLAICKFEEFSDTFFLKDIRAAKSLPISPAPMMGFEVLPEDLEKSTTGASKPLPVLQIACQRQNKEFSSLDIFDALSQAQNQIANCKSIQIIYEAAVGIISELTGFHRAMFYQFDSQNNGCFPASDIPKQARALYIINRIRLLYDRGAKTARLVWRDKKDFKQPLDLTHAYLRATSPVHLKYLGNMDPVTDMGILESEYHFQFEKFVVPFFHSSHPPQIGWILQLLATGSKQGDYATFNIQKFLMMQRMEARRLPMAGPSTQNPTGIVSSSSADSPKLLDADFGLLSIDDKARAIGKLNPYQETVAIVSYLQSYRFTNIRCSQNIKADFPGLSYPPGLALGGLLLIPLNGGDENEFLTFFRKAKNPNDMKSVAEDNTLEPRTSFRQWVETVGGTRRRIRDVLIHLIDEAFNLKLLALRVLQALQKEAKRKSLDLIISTDDKLPAKIKGNGDCFKQVIVYFTSNAFKQSTNVKLDINVVKSKEGSLVVEVQVQDNGSGMTDEELNACRPPSPTMMLTDTVFRTHSTNSSKLKMTIIGHSQNKNPFRNLKGQIQVKIELGKGTIFIVERPFEHALAPDTAKPRKLRDILPSLSTSGGIASPSFSPFVNPPKQTPNETKVRLEPA